MWLLKKRKKERKVYIWVMGGSLTRLVFYPELRECTTHKLLHCHCEASGDVKGRNSLRLIFLCS